MVNTIVVSTESNIKSRELRDFLSGQSEEYIVQCPSCKSIETVTIGCDGQLFTTRKFYQIGRSVYHKCGAVAPCRLFRGQ